MTNETVGEYKICGAPEAVVYSHPDDTSAIRLRLPSQAVVRIAPNSCRVGSFVQIMTWTAGVWGTVGWVKAVLLGACNDIAHDDAQGDDARVQVGQSYTRAGLDGVIYTVESIDGTRAGLSYRYLKVGSAHGGESDMALTPSGAPSSRSWVRVPRPTAICVGQLWAWQNAYGKVAYFHVERIDGLVARGTPGVIHLDELTRQWEFVGVFPLVETQKCDIEEPKAEVPWYEQLEQAKAKRRETKPPRELYEPMKKPPPQPVADHAQKFEVALGKEREDNKTLRAANAELLAENARLRRSLDPKARAVYEEMLRIGAPRCEK